MNSALIILCILFLFPFQTGIATQTLSQQVVDYYEDMPEEDAEEMDKSSLNEEWVEDRESSLEDDSFENTTSIEEREEIEGPFGMRAKQPKR